MNDMEKERLRLLHKIVEGLRVKPAYLLLFGILVVFLFIVSIFAWSNRNSIQVVIACLAVIVVALILAAHIIRVVETTGRVPKGQRQVMEQLLALGTKEDIPISKAKTIRWAKKWNCRWTYLSESGKLLPYVDDNVTFDLDRIDTEHGLVVGRGDLPYLGGTTYQLFGRISKRDMGLLFYRGRGEIEALMGIIILRMKTNGDVYGWWLGIGKENMDIGGRFTWTEARRDPQFSPREYDVSKDPPVQSVAFPR